MKSTNDDLDRMSVELANKMIASVKGKNAIAVLEAYSMAVASACVEIAPRDSRELMNRFEHAAEGRRRMLQARWEKEEEAAGVSQK